MKHLSDFKCRPLAVLVTLLALVACQDKIYYLNVTPRTIAPYDSVVVSYKTRGSAKLLVHDGLPDPVSKTFTRHFKLVIPEKQGDDLSLPVDVTVFTGTATDFLSINHLDEDKNALTGSITNDTLYWSGPFVVSSITNTGKRLLIIKHLAENADTLASGATDSLFFKGAQVGGKWELKTPKSAAEKADKRLIPNKLTLLITLKHKPHTYEH